MVTRRKPKVGGMDKGPPSDIDAPYKLGPDGNPVTVAQAIIEAITAGEYLETAAPRCGIKVTTARGWLLVGGQTRLKQNVTPGRLRTTTHQRKCRDFLDAYETAAAQYEGDTLREIDEIARGGRRIVTVRSKRRFLGPNDTEGTIVERIEETRTIPPDGQLLVWRLAHRIPGRYSPKLQIQNMPPEEGALSPEEEAESLADALEAFLAGRDAVLAEAEQEART